MYLLKKLICIGFIVSEFTSYAQVQLYINYVSVNKMTEIVIFMHNK